MSDEKKARNLTSKGLLHRAKIAKSALGFFQQYREYLVSGELAPITSPIVAAVDSGDVLPTPALNEVINLVFAHNLAKDVKQAEDKMARNMAESQTEKAYVATIYDEHGQIATRIIQDGEKQLIVDNEGEVIGARAKKAGKVENLTKGFENHERAIEWAYRRLFEGASGWTAQIVSTRLFTKSGAPFTTVVDRDEAIRKLFPRGKTPIMHKRKETTNKLSFGVKARNDVAKFSYG